MVGFDIGCKFRATHFGPEFNRMIYVKKWVWILYQQQTLMDPILNRVEVLEQDQEFVSTLCRYLAHIILNNEISKK